MLGYGVQSMRQSTGTGIGVFQEAFDIKSKTKSRRTIKFEEVKPMPLLTKKSLEPVREKIRKYISSMPAERKIEHKYVMKVKGKCLNHFLGIIKSDLARLAVEGFP